MELKYVIKAGISEELVDHAAVEESLIELRDELQANMSEIVRNLDRSVDELYTYEVPKLSADGSCSIIEELDPTPYDLSNVLGGRSMENNILLNKLKWLLSYTNQKVGAEWIGIYKRYESKDCPKLVKLAYSGIHSRAEFPLTEEFAKKSNNSKVGITGKAVIINDLEAHLGRGEAYYKCDGKVRSEACLPIYTKSLKKVVGIVDSEAYIDNFFSPKKIAYLAALCLMVGKFL